MSATWHSDRYDRPEVVVKMGPELSRVRCILDREEFCVHETDLDSTRDHQFLGRLRRYGAIEVVDTVRPDYEGSDNSSHYVNKYRWERGIRDAIREYLDGLTELPCGHHVHIHNPHDSAPDELGCKVCAAEGVETRHPKPLVRDLLSNRGSG